MAAVTMLDPTQSGAQGSIVAHDLGQAVAAPITVSAVPSTSGLARLSLVSLSDGRVLVADAGKRVLSLFDASFAHPITVMDSTPGKNSSFSSGSVITSFRGDSALFYDRRAGALVVIQPDGTLGSVIAAPTVGPTIYGPCGLTSSGSAFPITSVTPAVSRTLGLIYRASPPRHNPPRPAAGEPDVVVRSDDSVYLVRMDFDTRKTDTVVAIGTGSVLITQLRSSGSATSAVTPLFPFYDDAVVMTDGSLAIFHAREYRLEWLTADGQRSPGKKLTYSWLRVTDDDRQRLLDSVNSGRKHLYDSALAKRAADSARTGSAPTTTVSSIDVATGAQTSHQAPAPPPTPPAYAVAAEIPDFRPPTGRNALLADADNHLWLLPLATVPPPPDQRGAAIWDVIDRDGVVIDRMRIPEGKTIAGFGPGGIVYLVSRDAGITTLQKVRIR